MTRPKATARPGCVTLQEAAERAGVSRSAASRRNDEDRENDIVFETARHWVKRVPSGFEVYRIGITHSTRVAVIGYSGDKGLQRAKLEIERRESTP